MTRGTKIVGAVFAVALVALGAFAMLFDANQLRGVIQAQLQTGLKRKVSLGEVHLGLFPPALRVAQVAVGENPPLVSANEVELHVALWPLLSKNVEVQSLLVSQPVFDLVETAPGHWNYQSSDTAKESNTALSIAELVVTDGKVTVTELGKPREVYEHIDLKLVDYAPGRTMNAEITMQLPRKLNLKAALKGKAAGDGYTFDTFTVDLGKLHLSGSGTWSDADTNLALKVDRSNIADLTQVAAAFGKAFSPDMKVKGEASADLRIAGPSDRLVYSGIVNLNALEVTEAGWAQPVRIPAARLDIAPHEIRTNTFTVESGSTRLTASALVNEYASDNGDYQATLRAPSAELGELLHMASIYGGASLGGVAATGKASLDVTVRGKMAKNAPMNFAGKATVDGAKIRPSKAAEPIQIDGANMTFSGANAAAGNISINRLVANGLTLSNVRTQAKVQGGVITLDPLSADMAGGRQVGSLIVDTRPAQTTYALRTKMDRADANQVLSATTSLKEKIFGLLTAEGNVRLAPKPGQEMAQALSGTFGLRLANGKLAGVNLVNEMAGLAKLLGFRKQDEAVTNILGLTGNWAITNGLADTRDLKMTFDGGSLAAAGTVDLATQAIRMKVTTTMNRAFTDQFSGNKIGGLLTTVLTNRNGEMIIPAIVGGTMSSPSFAPDTAEMARLRVQGIVPTNAADAVDTIGGAVDAIRKGGAKGVLDILKGRKQ